MRRGWWGWTLLGSSWVGLACSAYAADVNGIPVAASAVQATASGANHDKIRRASLIIGTKVQSPAGEELGRISDIVLDPAHGSVAYVVLQGARIGGTAGKLYAVPWPALSVAGEDGDIYQLNMDRSVLGNAPSFDDRHWPDFTDRQWNDSTWKYYGVKPPWLP